MSKIDPRIQEIFRSLKNSPPSDDIFNPWWEIDPVNEIGADGPAIRRRQYGAYLSERIGRAKYLLVGEAPGYQGGHFSGIPMTSERILLGHMSHKHLHPERVFTSFKPRRTSKPAIKLNGFSEPTATIVWGHLAEMNIDTYEVVIWNGCPWHPFDPRKGMLSNRTPREPEVRAGEPMLARLLKIMQIEHIVAVGNKAHGLLSFMGYDVPKVRHPASGGVPAFKNQFTTWIDSLR